MAYEAKTWYNDGVIPDSAPEGTIAPVLDADSLNAIETGIEEAHKFPNGIISKINSWIDILNNSEITAKRDRNGDVAYEQFITSSNRVSVGSLYGTRYTEYSTYGNNWERDDVLEFKLGAIGYQFYPYINIFLGLNLDAGYDDFSNQFVYKIYDDSGTINKTKSVAGSNGGNLGAQIDFTNDEMSYITDNNPTLYLGIKISTSEYMKNITIAPTLRFNLTQHVIFPYVENVEND